LTMQDDGTITGSVDPQAVVGDYAVYYVLLDDSGPSWMYRAANPLKISVFKNEE